MNNWFLLVGLMSLITGYLLLLKDLWYSNNRSKWIDATKFHFATEDPYKKLISVIKILGLFWLIIGLSLSLTPLKEIGDKNQGTLYLIFFVLPLGGGLIFLRRNKR